MRRPAIFASALIALTYASSSDDILELQKKLPKCSIKCIAEAATAFGCEVTDIACQCKQVEAITQEVAPCLVNEGGCSFSEITDAASAVAEICLKTSEENGANSTSTATTDETTSTKASEAANEASTTDTPDAASRIYDIGLAGIVVGAGAMVIM